MKIVSFFAFALIVGNVQADQTSSGTTRHPPSSTNSVAVTIVSDSGPPEAIKEIRKLAADYNAAMVRKDRDAMLGFYFDGDVPVHGVLTSASYALLRTANGDKVPKIFSSPAKQAAVNDTAEKSIAEKVSNLSVQTDGAIATVQYDYVIPQGHGHTFWTLAHTEDAWKITAIVYSINLAALDKK